MTQPKTAGMESAMETLRYQLRTDEGLYYAWQANIAMAFKDEFDRAAPPYAWNNISTKDVHEIANDAAKNFLNLLIK